MGFEMVYTSTQVAQGQDEVQERLLGLSPAANLANFDRNKPRVRGLRDVAQSTKLKNAITEVFSSGGKRLRPALCLLVP